MDTRMSRGWRYAQTMVLLPGMLIVGTLASAVLSATTVVPITDRQLFARADVIVHGIVASSRTVEDALGRPETVTVVQPLAVLKGRIAGALVLHQLGGELPDGRFFKLWGRPEYQPGREVVVFAIERPEGDYQTAELLLGKFEVRRDDTGVLFAVPSLANPTADGVTVVFPRPRKEGNPDDVGTASDAAAPRELSAFLRSLRPSAGAAAGVLVAPVGELQARRAPGVRVGGHPSPLEQHRGPLALQQRSERRLDARRAGERDRGRSGRGCGRHTDLERRGEFDDQLHDRHGRREPDPPGRSLLSLRLEHLHVGRRRHRLRRSRRRRVEHVAWRVLRDHHRGRRVAALLLHAGSLGLDHDPVRPDPRARPHAGPGTLRPGLLAARRVPR